MSEPIKEYGPPRPAYVPSKVAPGQVVSTAPPIDPRLPIIAPMAATIFNERSIYHDDRVARRMAVDQAFLLYGEIAIRLAENDR